MPEKLMQNFSKLIFFIIILLNINILCQDSIDNILNTAYSQMSQLPAESTLYFSRNIKCSSYNSSVCICLVNESLYKIEGENK